MSKENQKESNNKGIKAWTLTTNEMSPLNLLYFSFSFNVYQLGYLPVIFKSFKFL